jgi:hypothetical protein
MMWRQTSVRHLLGSPIRYSVQIVTPRSRADIAKETSGDTEEINMATDRIRVAHKTVTRFSKGQMLA